MINVWSIGWILTWTKSISLKVTVKHYFTVSWKQWTKKSKYLKDKFVIYDKTINGNAILESSPILFSAYSMSFVQYFIINFTYI